MLADSEVNQNINRLVFATLRYLLKQRIKAGAPVTYIDSTALTLWERRCWVRFAQAHACDIEAIFFDTPVDVCLARNAGRERVVPPAIIQGMVKKLVVPQESEGFLKVTRIAERSNQAPAAF